MASRLGVMIRRVTLLVLLLGAVAAGARFVNRDADFPPGVNWSGDLYTDEGWYNRAAVENVKNGGWYTPGDMNTSVNHPISPLLQRAVFAVFGMNLSSARLTICAAFVLTAVCVYLLARRFSDPLAAALATLLLSVNVLLFGYSRIAALDVLSTMFAVAALAVIVRAGRPPGLRSLAAGVLLLAVAVLTKGTAVFAIPLAAAAVWMPGRPLRENLRHSMVIAVIPVLIVGAYSWYAYHAFPEDYANYFATIAPDAGDPSATFYWAVRRVDYLGPGFVAGTALVSLIGFVFSPAWRRNRLTWLCLGWIGIFLVMLATRTYVPPRYYVPLAVPLALLAGTAVARLTTAPTRPVIAGLSWVVLTGIVVIDGRELVEYMRTPKYSFVDMAHQVKTIVDEGERVNGQRPGLLLGAVADSVGLETGVRTLGTVFSPKTIEWKLDHYDPTHWIAFADPEVRPALESRYRLTEVGSWDVFENYRNGERVRLFALERRSATR
jgi:4-amino-4-deoxy-L-arabinose transferase-like glycosyltransferase